jgi:hypothetical protein
MPQIDGYQDFAAMLLENPVNEKVIGVSLFFSQTRTSAKNNTDIKKQSS